MKTIIKLMKIAAKLEDDIDKEKAAKFKYNFKDGSSYFYLGEDGKWITDIGRLVTPSEYRNYLEHASEHGKKMIMEIEKSYRDKGIKYEVDGREGNYLPGSHGTDYNDLKYIKQLGLNIFQWHEFKKRAGELLDILDETDPPEEFDKMYEPIMKKLKEIMEEVKRNNIDEDYDKERTSFVGGKEEVIPYKGDDEVENEDEEEESTEKYILKDYLENKNKSFEELKTSMPANLRDFFIDDVIGVSGYNKFMSGMVGKTKSGDLWRSMVLQVRAVMSDSNIKEVIDSGSNEQISEVYYKSVIPSCKYLFTKALEDEEEMEDKIAKLVNLIDKYAKMIRRL